MNTFQQDQVRRCKAQMGEMFEDYVFIVRPRKNAMVAVASDTTWARGAIQRYGLILDSADFDNVDALNGDNE